MAIKGPVAPAVDIGKSSEGAFLRLPDLATLHAKRAARYRKLAPDSLMGEFLGFMASVSEAQGRALALLPAQPPVDQQRFRLCQDAGMPIYGRNDWSRSEIWRHGLDGLLADLAAAPMPASARATIDALYKLDGEAREALADRFLRGTVALEQRGQAFFVAAALQLYWLRLGATLDAALIAPIDPDCLCPICGSPPLVGLMDAPGLPPRSRYLHCPLCESDWRYVRAKCADCGETKNIAYKSIEGVGGPPRAETCDDCKAYVKLLSYENDAEVDPFADDLASVGLDIMVAEAGWHRNAPNPFLLAG